MLHFFQVEPDRRYRATQGKGQPEQDETWQKQKSDSNQGHDPCNRREFIIAEAAIAQTHKCTSDTAWPWSWAPAAKGGEGGELYTYSTVNSPPCMAQNLLVCESTRQAVLETYRQDTQQ